MTSKLMRNPKIKGRSTAEVGPAGQTTDARTPEGLWKGELNEVEETSKMELTTDMSQQEDAKQNDKKISEHTEALLGCSNSRLYKDQLQACSQVQKSVDQCNTAPPPSYALDGALDGSEYCVDDVLSESGSSGQAECKLRCSDTPGCKYISLWSTGGVNWCRLTTDCTQKAVQAHTINVYRQVEQSPRECCKNLLGFCYGKRYQRDTYWCSDKDPDSEAGTLSDSGKCVLSSGNPWRSVDVSTKARHCIGPLNREERQQRIPRCVRPD
jgi:hypothetical protein